MSKCEQCKYFVDMTTSNENGTEYDGYCILCGNNFDDGCNWFFPFKQIVGWFKKKEHDYHLNHEYDGVLGSYEQREKEEKKLEELIEKYLLGESQIYMNKYDGRFVKVESIEQLNLYEFWRIRSEYEDFAHPFVVKPLVQEWRELLKKSFDKFSSIFKPYFCQ
ncbi:MAG: hypothetical protein RSF40_11270 [Oscillospiraceae bacterium]